MDAENSLKGRQEGESHFDYCMRLIEDGKLKKAERQVQKIEEHALRRIAHHQLTFEHKLRKCLEHGKLKKAEGWRRMLISEKARRQYKEQIAALTKTADPTSPTQGAVQFTEPDTSAKEPEQVVGQNEPHSLARGLLIGKLEKDARAYPEEILAELTAMIESSWIRERGGKHSLGVSRIDLLVIAECMKHGTESTITLEQLEQRLKRTKSHIKRSVCDLQSNFLRGTGYLLEGDIRNDGVRLMRQA